MNKRIVTLFVILTGLTLMFYMILSEKKISEPVIIMESAALREMTIDDKIRESQIIMVGEVKNVSPSSWRLQAEKGVNRATPQEITDAGGLFTDYFVSTDQVLKGDVDEKFIRVRAFSGETEQVRWINSSQPIYEMGRDYLLFLGKGIGPTANDGLEHYRSVNANFAVYEIIDGKAISADDQWLLEDLIAYIENSLSSETTPVLITDTPAPTETSTLTPTPIELLTETPLLVETPTTTP